MSSDTTSEIRPPRIRPRDRLILAILLGITVAIIAFYLSNAQGGSAGDLRFALSPARDWLKVRDPYSPYQNNPDPIAVPYPFTAVLLTIPLSWLPDNLAASLFSGVGAGVLAWFLLRQGNYWRLLIFLSWPFANTIVYTQWSSFIASMYFTPALLPLLLAKPQSALPYVLTQKPGRLGVLLAGSLLILSIALYPSWPVDWLRSTNNYIGYPPLFVLPFGPLLLFALIRYRDKRSWFLVLMALMPQRMVYDQLGVLLVAENRKQAVFLVLCSWLSFPALLYFNGWANLPYGWKNWILVESYLPALFILIYPSLKNLLFKVSKIALSRS